MSVESYIAGSTVPCRAAWTKKSTGVLYTPDQGVTISIWVRADGTNTVKVTDQAMPELSTGLTEYVADSDGWAKGEYFWLATGTDGTGADEYIDVCDGHFTIR